MPVTVTCAACSKQFTVPDHYAGRSGKCTQCGTDMHVPQNGAAPAPAPSVTASDDQLSQFGSAGTTPAIAPPPAPVAAAPAPTGAGRASIGTDLAGYKLHRKLGDARSMVVLADSPQGQRVALKVLPQAMLSKSPVAAKRFLRESRSLFGLSHPNVATVLDAGEELGNLYIAMEYFEGRTLRDVLADRKKLAEPEALKVARQVASALGHLAKNKLLHRNVKPEHILLDPRGQVKLVGLGLVRGEDDEAPVTQQGLLVGTAQYLAPEMSDMGNPADHRADFFSLGVTLYEMLTGEVPWLDKSAMKTVQMVRTAPTPPLKEKAPGVSPATVLVVEKLLAKEAAARYPSADLLVADLEAIEKLDLVDGKPPSFAPGGAKAKKATTPGVPAAAPAPGGDALVKKLLVAVVVLGVLVVALGVAVLALMLSK